MSDARALRHHSLAVAHDVHFLHMSARAIRGTVGTPFEQLDPGAIEESDPRLVAEFILDCVRTQFAVKARAVADFLYGSSAHPDDLHATSFIDGPLWKRVRPKQPDVLDDELFRRVINKQWLHITTVARDSGNVLRIRVTFVAIQQALHAFLENADADRLHPDARAIISAAANDPDFADDEKLK